MRLKFGINFEFKLSRDGPADTLPHYDGSTDSNIERLPEEAERDYEDRASSRLAPRSKRVVGFVGNDIGRHP